MKNFDFDWQINEFMIYCRSTQLRERTMYSYEQTLRLFERWCADELKIYSVDKVTENVIRKYINDLQERRKYTFYVNDLSKKKNYPDRRRDYRKPVTVTTINNYIRNIRVFFNWLERDYVIRKNPMRKIRQLKYNRQAKVFLTDEDLRKLISKFDKSYFTEHRDYVMILLMLDSGMRLGEYRSKCLQSVKRMCLSTVSVSAWAYFWMQLALTKVSLSDTTKIEKCISKGSFLTEESGCTS